MIEYPPTSGEDAIVATPRDEKPRSPARRRFVTATTPEYAPVQAAPEEDDGPQIDIAKVLWRRRWTIVILTLLGIGAGIGLYSNAEPMYQSFARLYLQNNAQTAMGDAGLGSRQRQEDYLAQQANLIRSSLVLSRAAARPGISELPSFDDSDNTVASLHQAVEVRVGDGSTLDILAKVRRAEDARDIVNAVINAYLDFSVASHREDASELLTQLQNEKDRREREREELWAQQTDISRQIGTIDLAGGRRSTIEGLELQKLSSDLINAQTLARDLRLTLDAVQGAEDNATLLNELLPELEEGGVAAMTLAELGELRRQLRDLLYTSGENSNTVLKLRKKISDLEKDIDGLREEDLQNRLSLLERRYDVAQARADELEKEYDDRRGELMQLNNLLAKADKVKRDIDFVEDWLRQVSSRFQQIDVAEQGGPVKPEIMEQPSPGMQVEPSASQLVGMGLVLGLMGGFGLAFLQEWLDPRLRSGEEVEQLLALPILGGVPKFGEREDPGERARHMAEHPRSETSEAYRHVRTLLMSGLQQQAAERHAAGEVDVDEARTILVTSALSGDGKTTLACNLATALARLDKRTLLIDADCRRPRVEQHLLGDAPEDETRLGLSSVLQGDAPVEDCLVDSGVTNLTILPCGPIPADPAELLNSEALVDLLDDLSNRFDRIVVDSPPVLPVTDARVLGAVCEATVLVVRVGQTTRRAAKLARDGLYRTGAALIGIVVNDLKVGRKGYDYGGYGYGYGYGGYGDAAAPRTLTDGGRGNFTNGTHQLPNDAATNGHANGHAGQNGSEQHG